MILSRGVGGRLALIGDYFTFNSSSRAGLSQPVDSSHLTWQQKFSDICSNHWGHYGYSGSLHRNISLLYRTYQDRERMPQWVAVAWECPWRIQMIDPRLLAEYTELKCVRLFRDHLGIQTHAKCMRYPLPGHGTNLIDLILKLLLHDHLL